MTATDCSLVIILALQRSAKVGAPGLVNFIPAFAYHFCLNLPAAFTQLEAPTLADQCTVAGDRARDLVGRGVALFTLHQLYILPFWRQSGFQTGPIN